MNSIWNFVASFRDDLARDRTRAMRLCFAGIAPLWLALVGVLFYFGAPVIAREWPNVFTGHFSSLTTYLPVFTVALEPVLFISFGVSLGLWPFSTFRSTQAFTNALLSAVAARDTQVTRIPQSTSPDSEETREALTLEGLAHPESMSEKHWGPLAVIVGGLLLVMYGLEFVVPILVMIQNRSFDLTYSTLASSSFPLLWMPLLLFVVASGAVLWRFRFIAHHGHTVMVDDTDLSIRRAYGQPHERRILWSNVRGFAQFIYAKRGAQRFHVYILDGGSERFIWVDPLASGKDEDGHSGGSGYQTDNARRLVAIIERHADAPLLDISDAMDAAIGGQRDNFINWSVAERSLSIALSNGDKELTRALLERLRPAGPFSRIPRGLARLMVRRTVRSLNPDARERVLATTRSLLPYYSYPGAPDAPAPLPLPPVRRFLKATRLTLRQIALVALIIACLFPLWSGLLQAIMNSLYAQPLETALPARVLAEQPLYFATLTTPTRGWATRVATKDDVRSAHFTTQGYDLSLSQAQTVTRDNIVWNTSAQMPANGAIMVTVTVSPGVDEGSNNPPLRTTAGILFDGDASLTHGTLFTVDSFGDWELKRCGNLNSIDWSCANGDIIAMADGSGFYNSPLAPRPGGTTTFHLLIVRQGRTYLIYANREFLAALHDDTGPAAPSGAIGLYMDQFSQSARFTNLAVYPAATGLPFWAR